jgi:integrase
MVQQSVSVWATAKDWGYVTHDPFTGLKLPETGAPSVYCFSLEETLAIIDKAPGKWKTFFRIVAETGMRPGELARLRISDVSPDSLRIAQSVWQRQVQTPKTKKSARTFAISSGLASELQQLIATSEPNDYGLVFVTNRTRIRANQHVAKRVNQHDGGKPMSMDKFLKRVLESILVELGIRAKLKRLGIKRCGNYAFRHMNATAMDGLSVPLATRQSRLGHAPGSRITLGTYTHGVDAEDSRIADALGSLLNPKETRPAESLEVGPRHPCASGGPGRDCTPSGSRLGRATGALAEELRC